MKTWKSRQSGRTKNTFSMRPSFGDACPDEQAASKAKHKWLMVLAKYSPRHMNDSMRSSTLLRITTTLTRANTLTLFPTHIQTHANTHTYNWFARSKYSHTYSMWKMIQRQTCAQITENPYRFCNITHTHSIHCERERYTKRRENSPPPATTTTMLKWRRQQQQWHRLSRKSKWNVFQMISESAYSARDIRTATFKTITYSNQMNLKRSISSDLHAHTRELTFTHTNARVVGSDGNKNRPKWKLNVFSMYSGS